uniref:Putative peptide/nitrate transporter n=1 Tax=Noccaea caerulescens TaxID=107243 RepID=A0A1J3H976_NOCCA
MADDAGIVLLEKKGDDDDHQKCHGCNIDRLKQEQRGVPYINLSFIWLVSLCTALPISSLFPYLYFMIRDFHIAKEEEDIGFYAGFVASSFMIGRAMTSIFWGKLADRYGRKPIILIGTFTVIIFNTLFGLSTSFWLAISTRFLLGCFNCLLGVIRAYAAEVVSEEYTALSLSVVSTSRGIGLILGPAIGGYLAQPAEKYPNFFSQSSVFGRFPYFLPSLVISVYATGVLIACWWIPETLHTHCRVAQEMLNPNGPGYPPNEVNNDGNGEGECGDQKIKSEGSLMRNRPLMAVIVVYCVFSLQEIAYSEIFSLWAVSDRSYGGLSFSSQDVGEVLAISGLGLLVFQLLVYPPLEKTLGLLVIIRLSAFMLIPLLSCYPSIATLSGVALHLVINCASILKNALSISLVTGLFILLNKAVPQSQRGAANGISMTAMSIFKSFGPAGGGVLFSWAQKRQVATFLPGDEMVFFVLNLVQLVGLILTFIPYISHRQ